MTRYGMAIDLSRCIGCNTCAVACKVSNNLPKDVWWNVVHTEGRDFADTSKGTYGGEMQLSWLPVNCMHCENAVCEEVCPTGRHRQARRRHRDGGRGDLHRLQVLHGGVPL